jgi:hypothetical protein
MTTSVPSARTTPSAIRTCVETVAGEKASASAAATSTHALIATTLAKSDTQEGLRAAARRSRRGAVLLPGQPLRGLGRPVLIEHVPATDVAHVVTDRNEGLAARAGDLRLVLALALEQSHRASPPDARNRVPLQRHRRRPEPQWVLLPIACSPDRRLEIVYILDAGGVVVAAHLEGAGSDPVLRGRLYELQANRLRERILRELAAPASNLDGVQVTHAVHDGLPVPTLHALAAERRAALLVSGTAARADSSGFSAAACRAASRPMRRAP